MPLRTSAVPVASKRPPTYQAHARSPSATGIWLLQFFSSPARRHGAPIRGHQQANTEVKAGPAVRGRGLEAQVGSCSAELDALSSAALGESNHQHGESNHRRRQGRRKMVWCCGLSTARVRRSRGRTWRRRSRSRRPRRRVQRSGQGRKSATQPSDTGSSKQRLGAQAKLRDELSEKVMRSGFQRSCADVSPSLLSAAARHGDC